MENVSRDIKLIGGPDEVSSLRTTQYNMYFSLSHENIEIWKIIVIDPVPSEIQKDKTHYNFHILLFLNSNVQLFVKDWVQLKMEKKDNMTNLLKIYTTHVPRYFTLMYDVNVWNVYF